MTVLQHKNYNRLCLLYFNGDYSKRPEKIDMLEFACRSLTRKDMLRFLKKYK